MESEMSPKYPRTSHLPFSPGGTNDDRRLSDVDFLIGNPLIATEKMDGSNVCLERDVVYARSHSGPPAHPSFDALKSLHASLRHLIPNNFQIFGEWLYARHSISYNALPSHLMIFGARDLAGQVWVSWDEVEMWAAELGVPTVPVLERFCAGSARELERIVVGHASEPSSAGPEREGVVVRVSHSFSDVDFPASVAKWVRANHVQTDEHWKNQEIVRNGLVG
jgi:hypothetical protein